jgi:predicted nucleic acid-binding protein
MPAQVVIDTTVLKKANRPISGPLRARSRFARRVELLEGIRQGHGVVLYSRKLLAEYERQVRTPRNDFVQAFFQILSTPGRALYNWARRWPPSEQEKARKCRYPKHDDHVLRTAISGEPTTIVSEDQTMIRADECIHRHFRVHIVDV